mmetsp:Transcript_3666/g.16803  ORF Transcript_3666/g.16803 Transcript_3666/m.16803 type:complete len:200 (-) Transcript_3666:194-793(-)
MCAHSDASPSGITTYTPQYRNHATSDPLQKHAKVPITDFPPRPYRPPKHRKSPKIRPAIEATGSQNASWQMAQTATSAGNMNSAAVTPRRYHAVPWMRACSFSRSSGESIACVRNGPTSRAHSRSQQVAVSGASTAATGTARHSRSGIVAKSVRSIQSVNTPGKACHIALTSSDARTPREDDDGASSSPSPTGSPLASI